MKTAPTRIITAILTVAVLMAVGSQDTQAQRFSFGGKSKGKSGGASFSNRGNFNGSSNSRKSQPSLRTSFSGRKSSQSSSNSFLSRGKGTQNLNSNRKLPSTGLSTQLKNQGNFQQKSTRQFGNLKNRVGNVTGGKLDFNNNKFNLDKNKIAIGTSPKTRGNSLDKLKDAIAGNLNQNKGGFSKNRINSSLLQQIHHNRQHNHVCISNHNWCHTKPKHCHWWYNWCEPIRYCEPTHHVNCSWDYVTCDYIVDERVIIEDARWYLGMKGLLLPGKGIGIESVAPGSPAASVGLQAGMVITRCNGVDLIDETALDDVITHSQGVLQMDLLLTGDETPATCVVVMQRIASHSY